MLYDAMDDPLVVGHIGSLLVLGETSRDRTKLSEAVVLVELKNVR